MKIKTNQTYKFIRAGADRAFPHANTPASGSIVRTIKSPLGCPKFGVMGHGYVEDAKTGEFIGLVSLQSLNPLDSGK